MREENELLEPDCMVDEIHVRMTGITISTNVPLNNPELCLDTETVPVYSIKSASMSAGRGALTWLLYCLALSSSLGLQPVNTINHTVDEQLHVRKAYSNNNFCSLCMIIISNTTHLSTVFFSSSASLTCTASLACTEEVSRYT